MADLPPLAQAKKAISHVLRQRHNNPQLAYFIAPGSQSFALLTEAASTLFDEPLAELRAQFAVAETVDPGAWKLALEKIHDAIRDETHTHQSCECKLCRLYAIASKALEGRR